jgi:hypothetical protein
MKERSQLDEMRAAVRGDLERFRARQRANGIEGSRLERVAAPEPEPVVDPPPEPVPGAVGGPVSEPEPELAPAPERGGPDAVEEPRPGLFSRLFGRR